MKIKRFVAPDMRTVLRMVREEQGADAVILSNRPVPGGVRGVLSRMFRHGVPSLQVLAYSEIPEDKRLKLVGSIG